MNQTQRLIDSIRDAPHDAVIVAGMFAIPALIALWIVNRMRHPERGLLGVTSRNGNNRTLSDSRRLGKRRVGVNPSLTSGTGC